MTDVQQRFHGRIAGIGSTSGVRVVIGRWDRSPWGSFADVMVERADGRRILLAPDDRVADFVAATYSFDEVRIESVVVTGDPDWSVRTDSLTLDLTTGRRTALGRLLRLVPHRLATAPGWTRVTDPVSRVVMRGVRTRGRTTDRSEFYGASDVHAIVAASGTFEGAPLGSLTPVDPPPRFGFSSTPRRPSVTSVTTTVVLDADR